MEFPTWEASLRFAKMFADYFLRQITFMIYLGVGSR